MAISDSLTAYQFHNPDARVGLEAVPLEHLRRRLSPEARVALHRGDFHQLFVVTSGEVHAAIDFMPVTGGRGAVLHVRPGQVMRLPTPSTADSAAIALLFTPAFPQPLALLADVLGPFGPATHELGVRDADAVENDATDLATTYAAVLDLLPDPKARALLRQVLGVVLLRLAMSIEQVAEVQEAGAVDLVHRFRVELERSFATTRSAAAYAARLGYSARTLSRACVAVTGRTAKEEIDARVLLEAKRLLAHTAVPVSTIARRLGFSEPTNFAKFFTRRAGMTPGTFRAENEDVPSA